MKKIILLSSAIIVELLATGAVRNTENVQNTHSTISRLLVNIDPKASFSPAQFSNVSSATLVYIDARNPYKAFYNTFLDNDFVVISES